MPVYFVYRCHYGTPSERHVRRFEHDTVLDWARAVFKQLPTYEEGHEYGQTLLGGLKVYSFGGMFAVDDETGAARQPPKTMKDVHDWFTDMYEQESSHGPHHVQLLTDDDEIQMAVYVFDDHYRKKKPGKTDFLLLDGWELPAGESDGPPPRLPKTDLLKPSGGGEGTLYAISLYATDSCNLEDLYPANRVAGLRVPDLARHLLTHPEADDDDIDLNDIGLRQVRYSLQRLLEKPKGPDKGFLAAIRKHPDDLTNWGVYSDWLQDRDLPPAGLHLLERALRDKEFPDPRGNRTPKLDCVKVTPHMAQACKNEGRWPDKRSEVLTPKDTFTQFIFFDDRWAAAHPTLATGVLTFASRWDVLS